MLTVFQLASCSYRYAFVKFSDEDFVQKAIEKMKDHKLVVELAKKKRELPELNEKRKAKQQKGEVLLTRPESDIST